MHKTSDGLLTTAQVASRLNRSPETINRWVRLGRLTPAVQYPGAKGPRLFDPADVARLAAEDDDA